MRRKPHPLRMGAPKPYERPVLVVPPWVVEALRRCSRGEHRFEEGTCRDCWTREGGPNLCRFKETPRADSRH